MRVLFIGASHMTSMTAGLLVQRGHEVVVIETDKEAIDAMAAEVDCSFLHGDGTRPHVLREAEPGHADVLFCLSGDDRVNILGALVGRSLGVERVIPAIKNPDLWPLCQELGLDATIIPDRTIGRYLADTACGLDILELSGILRAEARFFSFTVDERTPGTVGELGLPEGARAVFLYRREQFQLVDPDTRLKAGDEVVIVTHSRHLAALRERWQAPREE